MRIRRVQPADWSEWLRMRTALWPDCPREKHEREMALGISPAGPPAAILVAERPGGGLGGFIEVGLRNYAEGCDTSPVGYIEGWYVDPELRKQGVGAALVRAGEEWARAQGCTEMGSDCRLDNEASLRAHLALGYVEAERAILFCKRLE